MFIPKVPVHYATSANTVCGVHISGGGNQYGKAPVQHTCILSDVTCANCRNSMRYKADLKKTRK